MSTVHADADRDGRLRVFTKGALTCCSRAVRTSWSGLEARASEDARRNEILRTNEALAREALRTIGVAFRLLPAKALDEDPDETVERELVFAGLIGMIDPPRAEARRPWRARRAQASARSSSPATIR